MFWEILNAEIWIFFYSFEDNYQLVTLSFIYLQKNNDNDNDL